MRVTKRLDLPRLEAELAAASVVVNALGLVEIEAGAASDLYTYDQAGGRIDVPPAAGPVVNAHVPPPLPINFTGLEHLDFATTTANSPVGLSKVLIRLPLATLTAYPLTLVQVVGIDRANGVMKVRIFYSAFKRLNGGGAAVGGPEDVFAREDTGAPAVTSGVASWTITPTIDTNDAIVTVTSTAGRTVDWGGFVSFRRFKPSGVVV